MKKNNIKDLSRLKVAVVHDYFQQYGGAERVVEEIVSMFPQAHVYTALVSPKNLKLHWYRMKDWNFHVSWYGKIPLVRDYPSLFRFLAPYIWESFDFSGYDLVISSSGWFMCKGVITRPETVHISYVHHQNKFLTYYETPDDWQSNVAKRVYAYIVGTPLRMWDYVGSQRPDVLVANSQETRRRIQKYYRRDAEVVFPPIRDPHINLTEKLNCTDDYYLTVSRLSRPKHIEILVQAANITGITLYVVGKGRELNNLKRIAKSNVIFTGEVADIELTRLYLGARAFLFSAVDEDFGMAPVEAMMYAIPVIAYKSGGVKETVKPGVNGLLVEELTPEAFAAAIKEFEKLDIKKLCKQTHQHAQRFNRINFRKELTRLIERELNKHA